MSSEYVLFLTAMHCKSGLSHSCAHSRVSFTCSTTIRGGWRGSSSCTHFKTSLAPRSLSPTHPTTTKATQFSSITEEILRKWKQTFRVSPWYGTLKIVNHVNMLTILKLTFKIDFLSPFQPCLSLPKLFLFKPRLALCSSQSLNSLNYAAAFILSVVCYVLQLEQFSLSRLSHFFPHPLFYSTKQRPRS